MPDDNAGGADRPNAASPSPWSVVAKAHSAGQYVGRFSALAAFGLEDLVTSALATVSASGASSQPPNGADNHQPHDGSEASALGRAEAIVSRAGHQAATMTAGMREQLMRSAAFAREEAEDIMVDAQELRHRGRDGTPPAS